MHALEWIPRGEGAGLGRYSQHACSRFDELLEDAEKRGVYVQMCLDSFNNWSHGNFSGWHDNPFNVTNGGMLTIPVEYLSNVEARDRARKRFRYTVARWAYSPGGALLGVLERSRHHGIRRGLLLGPSKRGRCLAQGDGEICAECGLLRAPENNQFLQ